ncbi:hypothetical protein BCL69_105220 [Nitrosomonas communis]|uniref:Uncharacterized protein n=1 Tax=Nitrosomonas communis TaxID=44574 RepID=A0A5D3Y994_9PROT|nr:hypothetical protein BCL69_105220 [Nitrosomonas communis]
MNSIIFIALIISIILLVHVSVYLLRNNSFHVITQLAQSIELCSYLNGNHEIIYNLRLCTLVQLKLILAEQLSLTLVLFRN